MELEGPGRGELAQLVADHVRDDRGSPGPRLDDLLVSGRVEDVHLLQEVVVDERTLLQAAGHSVTFPLSSLPPGTACAAPADDHLVGILVACPGAALRLAPRGHRVASTRGLALAATQWVVHRVHGHTAGLRALTLP